VNRSAGILVLAGGIVLVAISLLADTIGIGGQSGFGWKQGIGLGLGVLMILAGAAVMRPGATRPDV
jgi:hypothetical protein